MAVDTLTATDANSADTPVATDATVDTPTATDANTADTLTTTDA